MYGKKSLLSIIIKIFFLPLFLVVGNIYPMDLSSDEQGQRPIITFRSLEKIPCWSLSRIMTSWGKIPEGTREKIIKQIIDSDDEKFLTLFNVAIRLPFDLQNMIAAQLYKGHDGAIKKFFKDPVVDVINEYAWSHKVFHKEEYCIFRKMCKKSSNWILETIFEQSKDVVIFEAYNRENKCHGYKALKSIAQVYNTFQDGLVGKHNCDPVKYEYCDSYTLTNFMKYQSLEQWHLLPIILTPFWGTLLNRFSSSTLSCADIFSDNEKKELLNAFIQSNFEKTGDERWLSFMNEIINPEGYKDQQKLLDMIGFSCIYMVEGVLMNFFNRDFLWENLFKYVPDNVVCVFVAIMAGCVGFALPFIFLQYKFFDAAILQQPVLGMAGTTICYATIVSMLSVIKMRSVKKDQVAIAKIPKLLKRADIEVI